MKKIIRWGILGCGNVTEIKSGPPYQQIEGFELKAVMRRDKIKAQDYAKRHKVEKYYATADALINDPEIDAVYIATPPDSHKLYGLKVAAAGKTCCIEKPLSTNYKDSLEIASAFEKNNTPLFVAYYRRSLPRFTKIKDWLNQNHIGEVRHVSWRLTQPASKLDLSGQYNWRTDKNIAPGGYFDDLACHGLDLLSYFLGPVIEAHGVSQNQLGLYDSKDAITASWIYESGIVGSGLWNFGSPEKEDTVIITGSKGYIQFSVFEDQPIVLNTAELKEEIFIENPKHVQFYHVQNMRDHLLTSQCTHPSTGATACHVNWVMDRILGT